MSKESAMAVAVQAAPVAEAPQAAPETTQAAPEQPRELESTRFNLLAKKEAELVKQREEYKKEREAFLAERDQFKPIHEQFAKFQELKKTNPIEAIKLLEFSDEDFINYMATREDNSTPEEKARKAAQQEIERFQNEMKERELKAAQERNNKIITEFKQSIATTIASDKEKYEFANMEGPAAEELAYLFVEECVKQGDDAPTAEEAAQYVEDYYEGKFRQAMSAKKLTPKEAVAAAKEAIAAAKDEPLKAEVSPRPKTLSSKVNPTVASTVSRRETPSEKRERLIQKLASGG